MQKVESYEIVHYTKKNTFLLIQITTSNEYLITKRKPYLPFSYKAENDDRQNE